MTRRRKIENGQYDQSVLNIDNWPSVLVDNLSNKDKHTYLNRKKAVEQYFLGVKQESIKLETGITKQQLNTLVERCLQVDQNGEIWGFRALVPYKRIKDFSRDVLPTSINDNKNGAFQSLLDFYPDLRDTIEQLLLKNRHKDIKEPNIKISIIHKKFLKKCRELGLKAPNDYPFNTSYLGLRSLYNYVNDLENKHYKEAAYRYNRDGIQESATYKQPQLIKPFERVQFDGHKIDVSAAVIFNTPEGDEIVKVINRVWLLAIIDVSTRVILGYHISFNREYDSMDILNCVKNAIEPWVPFKLSIPGLKYPQGGGHASFVIPETKWAIWDEMYYDNARANLSKIVRNRLKTITGCHINAGIAGAPLKRSLIERFFGLLEENGFHRLSNTTGSHPNDPRRVDPENIAVKYRISVHQMQELTEVLIAEYNGSPHSGLYGLTPLEAMKQRIKKYPAIRKIQETERKDVAFMTMRVVRTICGSLKNSRRPHVNFENVVYKNEIVTRSYDLIGKKIVLAVNIDDMRSVKAYFEDGTELGILKASGYWGIRKHSLKDRKVIFKLMRERLLYFTDRDDPIEIYHRYLKQNASKKKAIAQKIATVQQKTRSEEKEITSEQALQTESDEKSESNVIPLTKDEGLDNMPKKKIRRTITY